MPSFILQIHVSGLFQWEVGEFGPPKEYKQANPGVVALNTHDTQFFSVNYLGTQNLLNMLLFQTLFSLQARTVTEIQNS